MRLTVNQRPVVVSPPQADMTLLRFLREQCRLTGTKEGCASGDCGACTVLVVDETTGGLRYRAVNSCICPAASVADQAVITVEGLADGDEPHPVQAAMVRCHGSQCGFCTPGFVMSLAGLHAEHEAFPLGDNRDRRRRILDAISGNLCRCTGYRPIVEAGYQALKKPAQMDNIVQKAGMDAPLASTEAPEVEGGGYWRPASESELQTLLKRYPQARLIAGGTDLMLEVTQQYRSLPALIDLNAVAGLNRIELTRDQVIIGAAARYTQLEQALEKESPVLLGLLERLGSRQIRNRGTVGGNIGNASPIADMPPFLLVVDAELRLVNADGRVRREPLTDFYLDYKQTRLQPGEYIADIRFRRDALAQPLRLFKNSKRYEDDISAVMGAFWWGPDGELRIAYGGMAAIPRRVEQTEALLNQSAWFRGGEVDEHVMERACECVQRELAPMSDVRASAAYRTAMAGNLLRKACREMAAERAGLDVEPGVFSHA